MFDLSVGYRLDDRRSRTRLTQESEARVKGFMTIVSALMRPFMKKASLEQAE